MKAKSNVAAEKLFWKHHAGPPWASRLVGTGQALSKILKDRLFLIIASDDQKLVQECGYQTQGNQCWILWRKINSFFFDKSRRLSHPRTVCKLFV